MSYTCVPSHLVIGTAINQLEAKESFVIRDYLLLFTNM